MSRHLTPAVHPSWLHRDNFRSDSTAANAVDQPSPASGAGSDRPSPAPPLSSLAGGLHAGEGNLHRGRAVMGSRIPVPPSAPVKPLSMAAATGSPTQPTDIIYLVDHLRGELGGSSGFERSSAVTPFGEVRGPERAAR